MPSLVHASLPGHTGGMAKATPPQQKRFAINPGGVVILTLAVVGAVWLSLPSSPSPQPTEDARALRIGMTPDEVERILGTPPTGPTADGDGSEWVRGSHSETHTITVIYQNGRVVRVGSDSYYVWTPPPPTFWQRVKRAIGI